MRNFQIPHTKKPKVETEARESILQKLQRNKAVIGETGNTVEHKKDKKKEQYR